ncbi:unnamed protein product [Sympodiomycopsis kandeliae]
MKAPSTGVAHSLHRRAEPSRFVDLNERGPVLNSAWKKIKSTAKACCTFPDNEPGSSPGRLRAGPNKSSWTSSWAPPPHLTFSRPTAGGSTHSHQGWGSSPPSSLPSTAPKQTHFFPSTAFKQSPYHPTSVPSPGPIHLHEKVASPTTPSNPYLHTSAGKMPAPPSPASSSSSSLGWTPPTGAGTSGTKDH